MSKVLYIQLSQDRSTGAKETVRRKFEDLNSSGPKAKCMTCLLLLAMKSNLQ